MRFLAACFAATFPFSTALTNIFFYTACIFASFSIFNGVNAVRGCVKKVTKNPILGSLSIFISYMLCSALWSLAPKIEIVEAVQKYAKLCFAFPLYLYFIKISLEERVAIYKTVAYTFLISISILAILVISIRIDIFYLIFGYGSLESGYSVGLGSFGQIFSIGSSHDPSFGRNHISQGLFLLLGFLFVVNWGKIAPIFKREDNLKKNSRLKTILPLLLASLLISSILCMNSKTAFVGLLVIVLTKTVHVLVTKLRGGKFGSTLHILPMETGLLILIIFPTLLTSFFVFPPPSFKILLTELLQLGAVTDPNMQTSLAGRLDFWRVGLDSAFENWRNLFFGTGVGTYAEIYQASDIAIFFKAHRNQPHSELVLLIVQFGLVGVVIFFAILANSLRKLTSLELRFELGLIILLYALTNSIIWDNTEGLLFTLFLVVAAVKHAKGNSFV